MGWRRPSHLERDALLLGRFSEVLDLRGVAALKKLLRSLALLQNPKDNNQFFGEEDMIK